MAETVLSILCGENRWDYDYDSYIKFNMNGKGEMVCRSELVLLIGAEFEWKALDPSLLNQVVVFNSIRGTRDRPHLISEFYIEITLTKRLTPWFSQYKNQISKKVNESRLTDEAFLPKTYTARLEKGNFHQPGCLEGPRTPRYALRLSFDESPYPSRNEWKDPTSGPDGLRVWQWKEFASQQSDELKTKEWGSCVIS